MSRKKLQTPGHHASPALPILEPVPRLSNFVTITGFERLKLNLLYVANDKGKLIPEDFCLLAIDLSLDCIIHRLNAKYEGLNKSNEDISF